MPASPAVSKLARVLHLGAAGIVQTTTRALVREGHNAKKRLRATTRRSLLRLMGDATIHDPHRAERQFGRMVFFSDAVFAIAITLLVLDLKPPRVAGGTFDLRPMLPGFEGFGISFFVIALYWMSHHELFGGILREDRRLRMTNLAFLATIAFLPYPTRVIAASVTAAGPVIFYALSVAAVGAVQVALILAARRPELMRPDETREGSRRIVARALLPPAIFLVSVPVALVSPRAATLMWILIWPGMRFVHRWTQPAKLPGKKVAR